MTHTRSIQLLLAILLAAQAPLARADDHVDETGALRSTVQFEVPPYHGIEPALGLAYSSQAGSGEAGAGWGLAGISTITRSDDRRGAPHYDATDLLWLDGEQLLPCTVATTSPGCLAGGTHATRVESFTRIIWNPASNEWWLRGKDGVEVTYRAQVAWNPLDPDSTYRWAMARREDLHGNAVDYAYHCEGLSWPSLGDCVLSRVSYGAGKACDASLDLPPGALLPGVDVRLYWETRPDTQSRGIGAGGMLESHRRLKSVAVSRGGALLRAWTLGYARASSSGASLLSEVQQVGDDATVSVSGDVIGGTRLPATRYGAASQAPAPAWSVQNEALGAITTSGPALPQKRDQQTMWRDYPYDRSLSLDVDGDGRTDFVKITADHVIQTGIARADGSFQLVTEVPAQVGGWTNGFAVVDLPTHTYWYAGDVDGDGLQDIMNVMRHGPNCDGLTNYPCTCQVQFDHVALRTALSNGDGTYRYTEEHLPIPFHGGFAFSWSFQWAVSVGLSGGGGGGGVSAHVGLGIGASGTLWQGTNIWIDETWVVGDADADGRTDFMRAVRYDRPAAGGGFTKAVRLEVFTSKGAGFSNGAPTHSVDTDWSWDDNYLLKDRFFAGDVDGDGRADLMVAARHAGGGAGHAASEHIAFHVAFSRSGGRFDLATAETSLAWSDSDVWFPGDADGDGKADFMRVAYHRGHGAPGSATSKDHGALQSFLSVGDGTFETGAVAESRWPWHQPIPCIGDWTPTPWMPGDYDNDGRTDVAHLFIDHTYDCLGSFQPTVAVGRILSRAAGAITETTFVPSLSWATEHRLLLGGGDFDGDGTDDLLFSQAPSETLRCENGNCGLGYWYDLHTLPSRISTRDTRNWLPADLDGDGRQDLVYVYFTNPGYRVQTMKRKPDGTLVAGGQTLLPPAGETLDRAGAFRFVAADVAGPGGVPDGKSDLVLVDHDGTTIKIITLISQGNGQFSLVVDRPMVATAGGPQPFGADVINWRLGDFDGDGLVDLGHVRKAQPGVDVDTLVSLGDGHFRHDFSHVVVDHFRNDTRQYRPADANGDGRTDLVYVGNHDVTTLFAQPGGGFLGYHDTFLPGLIDGRALWRVAEINGDGRSDLVYLEHKAIGAGGGAPELTAHLVLSLGDGKYTKVGGPTWALGFIGTTGQTNALQLGDLDGDGKTDLAMVTRHPANGVTVIWAMNQYPDFALGFQQGLPASFRDTASWRVMDSDSDGRVELDYTDGGLFRLLLAAPADRITSIDNGLGGLRQIDYRPSAGTHSRMPLGAVLHTVSTLSTDDTLRGPALDEQVTYAFSGATWSFAERRFAGFTQVTSSGARGRTVSDYDPSDACGTRATQIERQDLLGAVIERSRHVYLSAGATAPFLCLPESVEHDECEGSASCRTVASVYHYDVHGNVVELEELGDVLDKQDDRLVQSPVMPNTGDWLVGLPAYRSVHERDAGGAWRLLSHERYRYDGAASFAQPATRGDVTAVDGWNDQTGAFVTTELVHKKRGQVERVIAPAVPGRKPSERVIDYDCTFDELPVQICSGGLCTTATWDLLRARPLAVTDASGETTSYQLDGLGRVVGSTTPDGSTLTIVHPTLGQWGGPGQIIRQELEDDATSGAISMATKLDGLGRTWEVVEAGNLVREFEYDGASTRVRRASQPHAPGQPPQWVTSVYDPVDRLVSVTQPDGARDRFGYDVGTSWSRNATGAVRTTYHDAWARVIAVREELSACVDGCKPVYQWTHYRYDGLGRLVEIVDDAGNRTTTSWDSLSRKLESCDPDRGCASTSWSDDGLLTAERDANGESRQLEYDVAGRRVSEQHLDASGNVVRKVAYAYDRDPASGALRGASMGALVAMEDSDTGRDEFWYDAMGRTTRERRCIDGTCQSWALEYDSIGRVRSVSYPDAQGDVSPASEVVEYKYDATGRLRAVPGYVDEIDYAASGQIERMLYANGVETRWEHDSRRLWLMHQEVGGKSGVLYSADYLRDAGGRITELTLANPTPVTNQYTYDSLDRLTGVSSSDPAQERELRYDSIGNLIFHNLLGDLDYKDPDHVHAVTSTQSGNSYRYDRKGNLLVSHRIEAQWAPDGMPTTILDRRSGLSSRYAYDPFGQLAWRKDQQGITLFFGRLVEQAPGPEAVHYYYIGNVRIAQRRAGKVSFYHADHLGSTRLMTDDVGQPVNRYDLGPQGESLGAVELVQNDYTFTPDGLAEDSGLVYLGARWLDPEIGRFISADSIVPEPYDPQSLNRYAFGRNDPVNRVDPTGHADQPAITMDMWQWHEIHYTFDDDIIEVDRRTPDPAPASIPSGGQAGAVAPETVGAAEPKVAVPAVQQPQPVAKPSTMTIEQWQAKQDPLAGLTPEAREAWEGILFDDHVTETYIEPVVHKVSMGARVLSFVGGPGFAAFANMALDKADENMRAAGRGDWDSVPGGETGRILIFIGTMTPYRAPVLAGLGGPRPVVLKVPVSRSSVGVHAGSVEAKYATAQDLVDWGLVRPEVGNQVKYSYHQSQRYVRDLLHPGQPIKSVRIPAGQNVDEFVARQFGGPQAEWNQHLMDGWVNSYLGAQEMNAARGLPKGTRLSGFEVQWLPRRRRKWLVAYGVVRRRRVRSPRAGTRHHRSAPSRTPCSQEVIP